MEKRRDKNAPNSKTLPPRKNYRPPPEFDFDFFSSTDSSTDWEVRFPCIAFTHSTSPSKS
jgi:hypothetical protein